MKIRLLKTGYKKEEELYTSFLRGNIDALFFSEEVIDISFAPDFPIYMGKGTELEKKSDFLAAFKAIANCYAKLDREIHFDERFWHSLFISEKRDYLMKKYPQIADSYRDFSNIVIKNFDWENYVYKCVLAVEYIEDSSENESTKEKYYELIVDNLDVFNYIIKYPIFRNGEFLLKILTVIDNLNIGDIFKAKIIDRPELGKDERYGRRVILELNKAYPVLMSPMLEVEDLEQEVIKALGMYYDISQIKGSNQIFVNN